MVMAEESIGFTPAGRAPAVAGSGQPPSASASTSTTSVTTAVATNKSSATSPTSQTLSQAPPSTHNNHNNPKNDDADAQENQADSPPINLHSHRQNPNLSKLSGLRSADRSSVYLSHHHHQRVVSQISVSPNPAPDSGGASPLNPVAEDGPHAIATTHQASAFAAASSNSHRPSSPSPGASNGVITSSPHSVVRQDHLKRSATYPQASSATDNVDNQYSPSTADLASPPGRRAPASRSSFGVATTDGPPPTLRTQRAQAAEGSSSAATTPETLSPRDSRDSRDSQGQRELLLLKSLSNSSPPDEKRASTHRPPVSYKPPASASAQNATSTPVRVPPIRSFRSSGSRKSLTLDMNYKGRPYDMDDDPSDPNYDRTLRALEGRQIQDMLQQMTPPTSARQDGFDPDDGGDVFLKIAREEGAARRNANESHPDEAQSSVVSFDIHMS